MATLWGFESLPRHQYFSPFVPAVLPDVAIPVALTATIHSFTVRLSDVDRGVYETLEFKAARHPSESAEFLAARVLAYCLEYAEGIAFSRGLSDPDQPAIAVRDLTGALKAWIDVGAPDAARLHKAAKAAPRVAVYSHRSAAQHLAHFGRRQRDPRTVAIGHEKAVPVGMAFDAPLGDGVPGRGKVRFFL